MISLKLDVPVEPVPAFVAAMFACGRNPELFGGLMEYLVMFLASMNDVTIDLAVEDLA